MVESFRDAEAQRVAAVAEQLWGVAREGVRLPDALREQTLHPSVRASALRFFRDRGIRWWTHHDEHGGRPTSLLRSSQVACVNHLEPARLNEQLAVALGRALGLDAVGGVPVEGGFLTYEWIGERNHLGEPRWGRRGDRCTSLDAFLPLRIAEGRVLGVAIEWKYTESPHPGSEAVSKNGTSRVETYRPLLEAPNCPIDLSRLDKIENVFFDPYTQLMRQTLLAWQMVEEGEEGVDGWLHVHVVPGANVAMRRPRAKLAAAADDLAAQWRSLLHEPDHYRLVNPTDLLAHIPPEDSPRGWREWLWVRYGT
jgi:hypothetical protein